MNYTKEEWKVSEIERTCYYCGHRGKNVNRITLVHVGGKGDVEYPCCAARLACLDRVRLGLQASIKRLESNQKEK